MSRVRLSFIVFWSLHVINSCFSPWRAILNLSEPETQQFFNQLGTDIISGENNGMLNAAQALSALSGWINTPASLKSFDLGPKLYFFEYSCTEAFHLALCPDTHLPSFHSPSIRSTLHRMSIQVSSPRRCRKGMNLWSTGGRCGPLTEPRLTGCVSSPTPATGRRTGTNLSSVCPWTCRVGNTVSSSGIQVHRYRSCNLK